MRVDTDAVTAKGKVRQVSHSLNIDNGSAYSEITIGISRSTAVGITDVETALDATVEEPVIENEAGTDLLSGNFLGNWIEADPDGHQFGSNAFGMQASYTETSFLVPHPEITQANVDEVSTQSAKEFIIDVPDEELILNA